MKYIHAIKGGFIALLVFIIGVIIIPEQKKSEEIKILLTVSTFLFAFLAGFFLTRLNSRYEKIREALALEDAHWLAVYEIALYQGKEFSNKIKDLMDEYFIIRFDYDAGSYYKHNAKYQKMIFNEVGKIINSNKFIEPAKQILGKISLIEERRNMCSVLSSDKLSKGQWIILLTLTGIILFSLFFIKTDELYSKVITVLLSTALLLIIFVLRDLNNLRLSGKKLLVESGQEVLENMGNLRYYNNKDVKKGVVTIPEKISKYRLGMHKKGHKTEIKIIYNKKDY